MADLREQIAEIVRDIIDRYAEFPTAGDDEVVVGAYADRILALMERMGLPPELQGFAPTETPDPHFASFYEGVRKGHEWSRYSSEPCPNEAVVRQWFLDFYGPATETPEGERIEGYLKYDGFKLRLTVDDPDKWYMVDGPVTAILHPDTEQE